MSKGSYLGGHSLFHADIGHVGVRNKKSGKAHFLLSDEQIAREKEKIERGKAHFPKPKKPKTGKKKT